MEDYYCPDCGSRYSGGSSIMCNRCGSYNLERMITKGKFTGDYIKADAALIPVNYKFIRRRLQK